MTQTNNTLRCILALDLGTTTGWALRSPDGLITTGTASFRPGRYDGGGMRYLRFTNWLTELDRLSGPIAAIWFEEVRRHAGAIAHVVAHVVGDHGGVARVIFRNPGFHLADEVSTDVRTLGEDAAAQTGKD